MRDLVKHKIENPALSHIKILNPSFINEKFFSVKTQISETENFQNFQESIVPADSFYTNLTFGQLTQNKRYWIRYKLDDANSELSESRSFYNGNSSDYLLVDSTSFNKQSFTDLKIQNNKVLINPKLDNISVTSAGYDIGRFCIISKRTIF